jgi:LysR family glycine cleavage system transcriptional activator
LEEQLGFELFARQGRGIVLTPEGRRLAQTLNRLLVDVANELAAIRVERDRPRLSISTVPSFSARWLTPRLGRFIEQHAQVELWVQSSIVVEQLAASGIDLAIRLGAGSWPGVHAEPFMDEIFLVVASPRLPGGLPKQPADLAGRSLIRGEDEPWAPWFELAGLDWPEPTQGLVFSDSGLSVQAAIAGQGIALARRSLVLDDLAAGRLCQVFDLTLPFKWGYWLVTSSAPPHRPVLAHMIDWLGQERDASIRAMQSLIRGAP